MNQLVTFNHELVKRSTEYREVLPSHFNADRMTRMVNNAVMKAQKKDGSNALLDANRNSLWSSVMTAASLGLECDGVHGQGYLIPFAGNVTFVPGYAGYITLAWNAGIILQGMLAFENDAFYYRYGTDAKVEHSPAQQGDSRGAIHASYAVADFGNDRKIFHVCEREDIRSIRDKSAGYRNAIKYKRKDNPWQTNFDAMVKKCPIRALGKNMPLSVQRATILEEHHDRGNRAFIQPDGEIEIIEAEAVEVDE